MKFFQQILGGFLAVLIAIILVIGGLSISLAEGGYSLSQATTLSPTHLSTQPGNSQIPTPGETTATSATPVVILTATLIPTNQAPVSCLPPPGWIQINVVMGDTLDNLAVKYNTTVDTLVQANCLVSQELAPDVSLYVPPVIILSPTGLATQSVSSPTQIQCGPPSGWVVYTVHSGDTLSKIGQAFRVDVGTLQSANCLGGSTLIYSGQKLYVPNVTIPQPSATSQNPAPTAVPPTQPPPKPSNTPLPTATIPSKPTEVPTPTYTTVPPTIEIPSSTPPPLPSATDTTGTP